MRYSGAAGAATAAVARMLRQLPRQQMKAELRRFKQLIETGEIATIDGQPSGARSATVRWFQRIMPATKKSREAGSGSQSTQRFRTPPTGPGGGPSAERYTTAEGAQS
jgi:hypothetical protein